MAKYSVSYVYEIVNKYTRPLDKISKSTDKFTRQKRKATVAVEKFKRTIKSSIGSMLKSKVALASLGAGIALFARGAITSFLTFEKSMNRVSAVTLATQDEIRSMGKLAKELGSTTSFTAAQSADALVFLSQAGLSVGEAMDALPGTLQLAAAGNMDLASAADIATNVLAQMGLEVTSLSRVNDVLAKSQSISNTDIRQLAGAMNTTGQTAAGMGIEIELLAASLGTMANAGLKAENAGTLFRNMILQTAIGAKKHRKIYKSLGVDINSFLDDQGKFKDFKGFISSLQDVEKTGKLTIPILNKLFGERGFRAAQVLIGAGADSISDFERQLKNAGGTAEEMARRQMAGLTGAAKEFASAWEGLKIAVLDRSLFGNLTEGAVRFGTSIVNAISPTGKFSMAVGNLARAVLVAVKPLAKFIAVLAKGTVGLVFLEVVDKITKGINLMAVGLLGIIRSLEIIGNLVGVVWGGGGLGDIGSTFKSGIRGILNESRAVLSGENFAAEAAANQNNVNVNNEVNVSATGASVAVDTNTTAPGSTTRTAASAGAR